MAEEQREQVVDEEPEKLSGEGGPPPDEQRQTSLLLISLGALGVVYGDLGTNTLFALRECFGGQHPVEPTPDNVLGVLSLIFWTLIIIVSIKYIMYVMRMDNRGEGGILALMALLSSWRGKSYSILVSLGMFGAALLYGDSMITSAISVLSAVEGLKVATPALDPYVVPITVVILILLFVFQRRGTAGIGSVFGPIMLVWFSTQAVLGISGIVSQPQVLAAVTPDHAIRFFLNNQFQGFLVLGAVFLVVAGGEALYADMGHFSANAIRLAWYGLVLPALLLNYFGQGAILLSNPQQLAHPFYQLAPGWALYPLVVLATMATVIASQAVISGVFSLSRQAAFLGLFPRLHVIQTSASKIGQIYVPTMNWLLMAGTIALVLGFRTSSGLAGAYGVAVSTTMVITTLLAFRVSRELWGWSKTVAILVTAGFLFVDLTFFGANMFRIVQGGWVALLVGGMVFVLMSTWKRGREIVKRRLNKNVVSLESFVERIADDPPVRVPGTAVFMSGNPNGTPPMLLHHLKLNQVLHETVILLTVVIDDDPRVEGKDRLEVSECGEGIYQMIVHFGFMEDPNVPEALGRARRHGLNLDLNSVTYYVGGQHLVPTEDDPAMAVWREKLFVYLARNAGWSASFYGLPADRVIELGIQIEL
jgi:KUP system potassium uptake protein